jgi:cyclopropane-fatty-acyl-phospholipid synthase
MSEVLPAIEKSGLVVTDVEILRLHYADTLKHWSQRFAANRDKAKAIYDERFCRMWEFYLAASEAAFRWQDLVVFQIQITKKNDTLPMSRDYMAKCEKALEMRDMGHHETAPAKKSAAAKPTRRRKVADRE